MLLRSLPKGNLISQGVDPDFADLITNPKQFARNFDIFVGKTYWDYFIPKGVRNVVPLWDQNADSYVRWERNGVVEFVKLYHDDPEWRFIAKSEQGLMAVLYQQYWESDWIEDEEEFNQSCRQLAQLMGFKYWETAEELLRRDYDEFLTWAKNLEG